MISIVIPLYNKERSIGKTIRTVLNQSCQDYEVVIVNDGSTDGSVEVVKSFSDSRIRLVNQPNAGVSAARNRGVEESRGEIIAFLDADDEWDVDYLCVMSDLVKAYPHCGVFASNYKFRQPDGSQKSTIINRLPFSGHTGELTNYFEVASCSHPPLWTSAVMVRKSAIKSVGGFPVGIKSGEDLLTWARLAARYRIAYSTLPAATFVVEGYDVKEKPKRIPPETDYVGMNLGELYKSRPAPGLKRYVAHWHKMRANIYMRLRMRRKSIRECCIGLRYNPVNVKLYAFMVLNMLPSRIQPF